MKKKELLLSKEKFMEHFEQNNDDIFFDAKSSSLSKSKSL
jgi:hypothetical protein